MKSNVLLDAAVKTRCVVVAEFRSSVCEVVNYVDKKTRESKTFTSIKMHVEFDGKPVEFSSRALPGVTPERYSAPATRGQKVVLELSIRPCSGTPGYFIDTNILGVLE
jgi:hypothetical protein